MNKGGFGGLSVGSADGENDLTNKRHRELAVAILRVFYHLFHSCEASSDDVQPLSFDKLKSITFSIRSCLMNRIRTQLKLMKLIHIYSSHSLCNKSISVPHANLLFLPPASTKPPAGQGPCVDRGTVLLKQNYTMSPLP